MGEWLEALREQLNEPWERVGWPSTLLVAFFLLYVVLFRTADGWTPFLDGVNVLFHEAGHPILGLFGWETLTILGGSLFQVLLPLSIGVGFWFKRQPLGVAFCGQWVGQNLLYVSRYIADARAQELPLIGGGEHDWTELLTRWNVLDKDLVIAGRVAFLGWFLMVAWALWLGWRVYQDRLRDPQ